MRHPKYLLPLIPLLVLPLTEPMSGWGLALGWNGLLIVSTISFLGWFIAAATWMMAEDVLQKFLGRSLSAWPVAIGVVASGFLFSSVIGEKAHQDYRVADTIKTNRIEYFCHLRFETQPCVQAIESCPTCLPQIDRWKRDRALARLKATSDRVRRVRRTAAK